MITKDSEDKVTVWDVLKVRHLLLTSDIACAVASSGKKITAVSRTVSSPPSGSHVVPA